MLRSGVSGLGRRRWCTPLACLLAVLVISFLASAWGALFRAVSAAQADAASLAVNVALPEGAQEAPASAGGSGAEAGEHTAALTALPPLLHNWCVPADKRATGWEGLGDAECMQRLEESKAAAAARVRQGAGTLLFKHVHKAGGSTLCQLAQRNMVAETAKLPLREDWDTNCVPYEAFLGRHPAVGLGTWGGGGSVGLSSGDGVGSGATAAGYRPATGSSVDGSSTGAAVRQGSQQEHHHHHHHQQQQQQQQQQRQLQARLWLGGACWLGFLTPAQLRVLPHHFRPLTFVASEGPLPDAVPLDLPFAMVTMLRHPWDRTLSSFRWWQLMTQRMPASPAECRAYEAPANASLAQWLAAYPDNWMTRELVGLSALYPDAASGRLLQLNASHLLVAKQRLHYFAAVLIMERWEAAARVMAEQFGWRDVDFRGHRAGSTWNSAAERELPPGELARLKELNALDLELYQYALALAAASEAALQQTTVV